MRPWVAGLLVLSVAACRPAAAPAPTSLRLFDGSSLAAAAFAGKVVVYNFFSPH